MIDEWEWEGEIIESLTPGPFSPDAPIPVLESVSPTGLVKITWDRDMQAPSDLDKIALEKVGLRDYSKHVEFGKGEGLARQTS